MEQKDEKPAMEYRYLGKTGLRVSALSFGNMVNHQSADPQASTTEIVGKCLEYGINFFDTAEIYSLGQAEVLLGQAFKDLKVRREDIVVTTKLFFGTDGFVTMDQRHVNRKGLSRKHIIEGTKNSLSRLQLEYVDVIYAHRYDQETPLEEVVKAFSWIIEQGYAFYWGTSEWDADQITDAIVYAQANGLHAPVTEQPQYNMLVRNRLEKDYATLFSKFGYGSTCWSPLASGILTGRYNDGNVPEDSRFTVDDSFKDFKDMTLGQFFSPDKREKSIQILNRLGELAKEHGFTQTQLALAWSLANKDVSSLILGFSKAHYVAENVKALDLYRKWSKELEDTMEGILGNSPYPTVNYRQYRPNKTRRQIGVFGNN